MNPQDIPHWSVTGNNKKSGQIGMEKRFKSRRPISPMIVYEKKGTVSSPILIYKLEKRIRVVGAEASSTTIPGQGDNSLAAPGSGIARLMPAMARDSLMPQRLATSRANTRILRPPIRVSWNSQWS